MQEWFPDVAEEQRSRSSAKVIDDDAEVPARERIPTEEEEEAGEEEKMVGVWDGESLPHCVVGDVEGESEEDVGSEHEGDLEEDS